VDDVNIFQHQLQWVTLVETTHVTDDYSSLLTTSRTYYMSFSENPFLGP